MAAAGCTFKTVKAYVPPGKSTHVPSLTSNDHWNTNPPSNGQHYPEWAVWGFYTQAINPRQVVHNEEHGGVILWWGPKVLAGDRRTRCSNFYDEQPDGVFGTPYPKLGLEDRDHRLDRQHVELPAQRLLRLRATSRRAPARGRRRSQKAFATFRDRLPRPRPGRASRSARTSRATARHKSSCLAA